MIELRPDMAHFAWSWAILPGFGPFWLDLGHFAWIWAIQFGFWPQRRRSPEGGAGGDGRMDRRTYVWTDGRTDSPCVLQDFVPFGTAAQKGRGKLGLGVLAEEEQEELKEEEEGVK